MSVPQQRRLIFAHIDEPGYTNDLACYLKHGGYEVMKKAVEYRQHAAERRKLAALMDGEHRDQLARMAETWEQLAEDRERSLSEPASFQKPLG